MARGLDLIPSHMDEREAYTNLAESLRIAEAACRQLAFMQQNEPPRGQLWATLAGVIGTARDNVSKLMRSRTSSLVLPN
jgi:hypothetical protein